MANPPSLLNLPRRIKKTSVLLGSGSALYAGIPSTETLSRIVRSQTEPRVVVSGGPTYIMSTDPLTAQPLAEPRPLGPLTLPAAALLHSAVAQSMGDWPSWTQAPNFEDMLHVVEELVSYTFPRTRFQPFRDVRPVIEVLTSPINRWERLFDLQLLLMTRRVFTLAIIFSTSTVTIPSTSNSV